MTLTLTYPKYIGYVIYDFTIDQIKFLWLCYRWIYHLTHLKYFGYDIDDFTIDPLKIKLTFHLN